jgi:UDP-2,3-diacylglucosamine pyrophosphatase LpxH
MSLLGRFIRVVAWLVWLTLICSIVFAVLIMITDLPGFPLIAALAGFVGSALAIYGYTRLMKDDDRYAAEVAHSLDRAFNETGAQQRELGELRLIVLSDLHKGTRDGADDFWRSERAYSAALGYYYELGYTLVVLGDAEELWENSTPQVIQKYGPVLGLEARFVEKKRYVRVWGNHDDKWRRARSVRRMLEPALGGDFPLTEAVKLEVIDGERELGTLFLAHGHQGTPDSEILTPLSRPGVRLFGALQRVFKRPWNTPATDVKLRERHDKAMFAWARHHREDVVALIAGHTHRPVFGTSKPPVPSKDQIDALREQADAKDDRLERGRSQADLQYRRAERRWVLNPPEDIAPPCYFNTGCCAFSDGDVTGIEIADREIRLVRFPDNQGRPRPQYLSEPILLADLFQNIRAYDRPAAD